MFVSLSFQHWKDVSAHAKDFIDKLLIVDPKVRLGAIQSVNHTWLVTNAASSSNKNLHRTISQNIIHRQSIRANSTKSAKSTRSTKSNKSNRSGRSLRSEHRRVQPEEIDELHRDPEVQADLASLGWGAESLSLWCLSLGRTYYRVVLHHRTYCHWTTMTSTQERSRLIRQFLSSHL